MTIDDDGWLVAAKRWQSPHFSPRPPDAEVALAVIHGISLPPGEFGGDAVPRLFVGELNCDSHPSYADLREARVSAHFFIRRAGELSQFVSCADAAWHAGESSWRGRRRCNDFSVGVELEGADDAPYDDRQYDVLAKLLPALRRRHPALTAAGHADIAPARKTDPGAAFDWARLFAVVGGDYDGRA